MRTYAIIRSGSSASGKSSSSNWPSNTIGSLQHSSVNSPQRNVGLPPSLVSPPTCRLSSRTNRVSGSSSIFIIRQQYYGAQIHFPVRSGLVSLSFGPQDGLAEPSLKWTIVAKRSLLYTRARILGHLRLRRATPRSAWCLQMARLASLRQSQRQKPQEHPRSSSVLFL
jgi:hypothetical protein